MSRLTPPDMMLWLTKYVREVAQTEIPFVGGIDVTNKEPDTLELPLTRPLIVIRDDSGPQLDLTTYDRSIGASVLWGTKTDDQPCANLARWLAGLLFDTGIVLVVGSPIASVTMDGCNGPYAVTENIDVARQYLTAEYVVTGSW